jgi:hypothetical protein
MADAAYGLWPLVILNTALFAIFAISFFHPRTGRDWRAIFLPRRRRTRSPSPQPPAANREEVHHR